MEASILRISVWDEPQLRAFGKALQGPETDVAFVERDMAEQRLQAGLTDLALVPTHRALAADRDDFELIPAVAYGSWSTPHLAILLPEGFEGQPEHLVTWNPDGLESLVARIVLHEHYGMSVQPVLDAHPDQARLQRGGGGSGDALRLDLGEEWYELTNYPMVWGLFMMRAGELDAGTIRVLRAAAASVESSDDLDGTNPGSDGMGLPRFRFDDIATASLTELSTHLYYYGLTSDIEEVRTARIPEGADIGSDQRDPQL
ncbi:MAG: hypothetical protein JJ896_09465 [Rhodothermales bacterium]|nr:hypothetical protein [Rhodothermales bacterium]MBO6779866.1 hypothetical protein [Rhodothermales bacterium]